MAVCCCVPAALGQITSVNADHATITSYINENETHDPIFVFNQAPQPKRGVLNFSLQLSLPYTFKWYKFDNVSESFVELPEIANISTLTGLDEGGYKVVATFYRDEIQYDSTFVAWLYMNPGFEFSMDNNNGNVDASDKRCDYTDFRINSISVPAPFRYFDPNGMEWYALANEIDRYTMQLANGDEEYVIPFQGNIRHREPPRRDTRYTFRIHDKFGCVRSSSIMYHTILPDATVNPHQLPLTESESAPVRVEFSSNPNTISAQNSRYAWRFGNGDSIVYYHNPPPPIIETFYTPGTYNVVLNITSSDNCHYPIQLPAITVAAPGLEVANVFSIEDNKFFKPAAVSLRRFEIVIFTRDTRQIYRYQGNDLRDWEGWDGRVQSTGREAPPGIYFYTIRAMGWDEPPTRNPPAGPYNGFFYLFR